MLQGSRKGDKTWGLVYVKLNYMELEFPPLTVVSYSIDVSRVRNALCYLCWGNELEKKKEHKSNTHYTPEFYVEKSNWEKSRNRTQICYIIRDYMRRRENLTTVLYLK